MGDLPASSTPPERRPSLARTLRLPRLSGKASAAWLCVCFLLTALLIPAVLRLPRWIDFEIVLAVWWAVWLAVLARLLYTGQRVTDDHQMREPRNWFGSAKKEKPDGESPAEPAVPAEEHRIATTTSWWDGYFWGSFNIGTDANDAIAIGCLVVIGLILLAGAAWFLIEVAIPLVLFLLYFVVRGMLAHVVNDRHHCRGKLGRALTWGLVWATVYTAPLAGVVWFVHALHTRPPS